MNKHEIQPFVGHGCFKVYEMIYIIKEDVNFHTFETLEKKSNPMRLELCHFSIHLTTCQPYNGNEKQYTNHATVTSCKFGNQD